MEATDFDSLTGLTKRENAMKELNRLTSEANYSNWVAIIFVDVFHMKTLCDSYGFADTDKALLALGNVVKSLTGAGELACRYGGDEFLFLLPGVSEEEARQRAEQLRELVAQLRVVSQGEPREHLTLSIGVAHSASFHTNSAPHSKLHGAEALMRDAEADLLRDRARNVERDNEVVSARNPPN